MLHPRRPSHGFTFLELLIVTLIICLLAGLLFPVFARSREKARMTDCSHHLTELALALRLYADEACQHFPAEDNDFGALTPFLPMPEILICPSDPSPPRINGYRASYRFKGGLTADGDPSVVLAVERNRTIHYDGACVLFLDGHVKWLKEQLYGRPYELGHPMPPTSGH